MVVKNEKHIDIKGSELSCKASDEEIERVDLLY